MVSGVAAILDVQIGQWLTNGRRPGGLGKDPVRAARRAAAMAPLPGHDSGSEGAALVGEPPPEGVRAFGVVLGDLEVDFAFAVPEGGLDAPAPVLPCVEDLVGRRLH
ncbi:hypothetical protein Sros01_81140 [Streptomyces roseochromogenus]|nr:hypothetical protein Sros01_81140 [Streptomyces roseochromogenus]